MGVVEKIMRFFHHAMQRFLLAIPYLSEARLGASRAMAFLKAWHYLSRGKVPGDYLEFGVYEGTTFDLSLRSASRCISKKWFLTPRFFAFDSFEGYPEPDSSLDGSHFYKGQCRTSFEKFMKTTANASKNWETHVVRGLFENSLTPDVLEKHNIKEAAFVNFDCTLHQSTLIALRFITPLLHTGTVIYFNGWFFLGGDMTLGEAGACNDWLKENPDISLVDFGHVGVSAKMFLVQRRKVTDTQ